MNLMSHQYLTNKIERLERKILFNLHNWALKSKIKNDIIKTIRLKKNDRLIKQCFDQLQRYQKTKRNINE